MTNVVNERFHGSSPFGDCSPLLVFGLWSLAFGLWLLVFGFWSLVFGLWLLVFLSISDSGSQISNSETDDLRPKTEGQRPKAKDPRPKTIFIRIEAPRVDRLSSLAARANTQRAGQPPAAIKRREQKLSDHSRSLRTTTIALVELDQRPRPLQLECRSSQAESYGPVLTEQCHAPWLLELRGCQFRVYAVALQNS